MNPSKFAVNGVNFEIRQATSKDYQAVEKLMIDTATWLKKSGSTQWNDILDGTDVHQIRERIHQNEVFLLTQKEQTAGTMIVRKTPSAWDENLWEEQATEPAFYVHRLMIARPYKGLQLSARMLQFAEELAASARIPFIRLDTLASNNALNQLYAETFTFLNSKDGYSLYQKKVQPS
ncbi:GNAT family N-acetyltransferase [Listeria sp. ILCC797]|uniref:GNAT family N-acetyltransferase n=1 Tax=Listeria sp. ILCC797 TaxID=1918333 RepID=UPI000B589771|nr:GNAT family N-acetyltransferase [Listeria sp. ILCC797]